MCTWLMSTHKSKLMNENCTRHAGHDFKLTTMHVMDGGGSYRTVGFMISDSEDTFTTQVFLYTLKAASGDRPVPAVAITDDASFYPPALKAVYGKDCVHILCWWHVGRSWVKSLSAKLSGSAQRRGELASQLHKKLGVLRECEDVSKFQRGLDNFLGDRRAEVRDFMTYFRTTWASGDQVWSSYGLVYLVACLCVTAFQ